MLDKLASLRKEDGKENFNYHWLYLSQTSGLTQEIVGWFANFKNERKQRRSQKSRPCRIRRDTASHTQLVKDKNEKSSEQKRLIKIQPNRTKSKACLKCKTSEWFRLCWNRDLAKFIASTTAL